MKNKGKVWILLGLLLIAAALFLTSYNLYEQLKAERAAIEAVGQLEEYLPAVSNEILIEKDTDQSLLAASEQEEIPDYILCPNMEMPVETINGIDYIGVLRIPPLELELPVISQWNYQNLKFAPCRYSGSAYLNNLIICGHNYPSHFADLKKLQEGDTATFTDMAGNTFTYQMIICEILNPDATEEMESGDWDLTLFTCTVGGQTRVAVRFELKGE